MSFFGILLEKWKVPVEYKICSEVSKKARHNSVMLSQGTVSDCESSLIERSQASFGFHWGSGIFQWNTEETQSSGKLIIKKAQMRYGFDVTGQKIRFFTSTRQNSKQWRCSQSSSIIFSRAVVAHTPFTSAFTYEQWSVG